jgi:hypothetical protein
MEFETTIARTRHTFTVSHVLARRRDLCPQLVEVLDRHVSMRCTTSWLPET